MAPKARNASTTKLIAPAAIPSGERLAHVSGGKLEDIPREFRMNRRWPDDPTPRPVDVKITSYKGIVALAQHYTLSIAEAANPIVMEDAEHGRHYRTLWDDREGDGFRCEIVFTDREQASQVADSIIGIVFANSVKHEIRWGGAIHELTRAEWIKKYRAPREGD